MPALRRVGLFGTLTRTNTLVAINALEETHASEVARVLQISLSQVQKAIDNLERAGIVVGVYEGRARRVRINPRYALELELRAILDKLFMVGRGSREWRSQWRPLAGLPAL